jgi:hypothetical protein
VKLRVLVLGMIGTAVLGQTKLVELNTLWLIGKGGGVMTTELNCDASLDFTHQLKDHPVMYPPHPKKISELFPEECGAKVKKAEK